MLISKFTDVWSIPLSVIINLAWAYPQSRIRLKMREDHVCYNCNRIGERMFGDGEYDSKGGPRVYSLEKRES